MGGGKQLEPLFLSVCMFNVRKRERISETIHIFENLNPPEVVLSLGDRVSQMAPELRAQRALFPLEALSPDVFLVFILEKTLRGMEVDETLDELARAGAGGASKAARTLDEVRLSASRLGGYRQPLAWAARCLFEKGRSILGTDIVVDGMHRFSSRAGISDAQLIAHLERVAEHEARALASSGSTSGAAGIGAGGAGAGGSSSNLGALSGAGGAGAGGGAEHVPFQVVLDFDLVAADKVLPHLVTPALELASATISSEATVKPDQLVRLVQQFCSPDSVAGPSREACNDLYIFLDWANFTKAQRRIKTISIRVTLHEDDENLGQQGLPFFYGRLGARLDRDCVCSVQYHERRLSM